MKINPSEFGAFHWNMLLKVERCIATLIPFPKEDLNLLDGVEYITNRTGETLHNYNDMDILNDLLGAGLIWIDNPDLDGLKLTDSGWLIAGMLRRMRAEKQDLNDFLYIRADMPTHPENDPLTPPSGSPVETGQVVFSELEESVPPDWWTALDEFFSAFMVRDSATLDLGRAMILDESGAVAYYPYDKTWTAKGVALHRLYELWQSWLPF